MNTDTLNSTIQQADLINIMVILASYNELGSVPLLLFPGKIMENL